MSNFEKINTNKYLELISTYFKDVNSSEISYRTPFENLLIEIFPKEDGYTTQHDQRAINGNKPDFIVFKNSIPILYIEVKKVGEDLNKIENSEQADRYFGYTNLIISDYVSFRFFRNGQKYCEEISLGNIDKKNKIIDLKSENKDLLIRTVFDFVNSQKEPIKSGKHLAQIMGGRARRIRDNVVGFLKADLEEESLKQQNELKKIMDIIKKDLITDIDVENFADMYAQTLVYGLFAARYNDNTPNDFTRSEARDLVPATNPFLQHFFDHISGPSFPNRLTIIVNELCEVFSHADVKKLMQQYFGQGNFLEDKNLPDPVIHFYEDFLKEYDSTKKMEMGVFYTPLPVVSFIIRSLDLILKNEFNIQRGLASDEKVHIEIEEINSKGKKVKIDKEFYKVQILDFATGTGTFLNEIIEFVYKEYFTGHSGLWSSYVNENLINRLYGFELMMASYTITHLKLGMTLQNTGVENIKKRLGVYLTNTLDKPHETYSQASIFGFLESIAEESSLASKVKKDYPIMIVTGNPPYSGISQNKHYTDNNVYKVEPGGKEKLKEKKNWLDDDYVKFFRFAESLIEKNKEGIVGMITAHGYIDNPTFRGMRWHLRNTFDSIYVLDLHGNSNKKEVSLDGSKDENVFDIKTGVSIFFGIKKQGNEKNKKLADVYHSEIYGLRKDKEKTLKENSISTINWSKLPDNNNIWRVEGSGKEEYVKSFSVVDMFYTNTTGIVTARDSFVIDINKKDLLSRINLFCDEAKDDNQIRNIFFGNKKSAKYLPGDTRGWKMSLARKNIINNNHEDKIKIISYRPFDDRFIYYSPEMVDWGREKIMKNFIDSEKNIGLISCRQVKSSGNYSHVFITNKIVESTFISNKTSEIDYVFPLYIYANNNKVPNINKDLWEKIKKITGDNSPENMLDYVYAYLYHPEYVNKYKEFLKSDFPRIPFPKNKEEFFVLVNFGERLRKLHLLDSDSINNIITTYPINGTNEVSKIEYKDKNVYINNEQYFGGIEEDIWNFYIGAYQPVQKYLKDRKGKVLSMENIINYEKMIVSISETIKTIKELEEKVKI